jgi:hypothetical protein
MESVDLPQGVSIDDIVVVPATAEAWEDGISVRAVEDGVQGKTKRGFPGRLQAAQSFGITVRHRKGYGCIYRMNTRQHPL